MCVQISVSSCVYQIVCLQLCVCVCVSLIDSNSVMQKLNNSAPYNLVWLQSDRMKHINLLQLIHFYFHLIAYLTKVV